MPATVGLDAGLAPLAGGGPDHYVDLAVVTSLLCGLGFLVFAVLRLGVLVRYRSRAVLIGDIGGLVTSALASQAPKMLRLEVDSARQRPHAHAASLAVRHRHGRAHGGHPALLAVRAPGGAGDRHRAGRNTGFGDGVAVVGTWR